MIKDWFYTLIKSSFLRWYEEKVHKRLKNTDLIKSFVDKEGRQYYRFPEDMSLPVMRMGKLLDYTVYMSAGLTRQELSEIIEHADKLFTEGMKIGKNASKIAFLLYEIRRRHEIIIHPELLLNILAVHNIREDEDPATFNEEIHLQKVASVKEEVEKGNNYFFYQAPELKRVTDSLGITSDELTKLYAEAQVTVKALNEALKTFLSPSSLESSVKQKMK